MSSNRQRLGRDLWHLADLLQADERRRSFRARAYRAAFWSLDDLEPDLSDPAERMLAIPGIGKGMVRIVEEFSTTGSIAELEELRRRYPREAGRLRRLPRMTPAMQRELKELAGVETMADLQRALDTGDAMLVRGVGEATAERWAEIVEMWPPTGGLPAHEASVVASLVAAHLRRHLRSPVTVAGDVRRVTEWVERLVVVAPIVDLQAGLDFLGSSSLGASHGVAGKVVTLTMPSGVTLDVWLSRPESFGSDLVAATGSEAHVARLPVTSLPTEEEVYETAGLGWVAPPAREKPAVPPDDLIDLERIRGDLHIHTDASPDGHMALEALVAALIERGYDYAAVTDHTVGLRFGGLDGAALVRQASEVDWVRALFPRFALFHGAEVNVDADGTLDIGDDVLGALDFVVAGVHSHFDLEMGPQTDRVVRALGHPAVKVLAHPTGRRIGIRPPIRIEFDRVVHAATEAGVALEANGHRDRLDLSAEAVERAVAAGVMIAANSDAHRFEELGNVSNAVATLQRAHVSEASVVNALPLDRFRTWLGTA